MNNDFSIGGRVDAEKPAIAIRAGSEFYQIFQVVAPSRGEVARGPEIASYRIFAGAGGGT
jgi:hypothetical protein